MLNSEFLHIAVEFMPSHPSPYRCHRSSSCIMPCTTLLDPGFVSPCRLTFPALHLVLFGEQKVCFCLFTMLCLCLFAVCQTQVQLLFLVQCLLMSDETWDVFHSADRIVGRKVDVTDTSHIYCCHTLRFFCKKLMFLFTSWTPSQVNCKICPITCDVQFHVQLVAIRCTRAASLRSLRKPSRIC